LSLAGGLTNAPAIIVFVTLAVRFASVDDAIHAFVTFAIPKVVVDAEARAAPRTATLTLVMARKRIATCKPAAALVACMGTLASVQFRVPFQIMQTTETGLACGTFVRLLLAVC